MMTSYIDFLASKALVVRPSGIEVPRSAIHPSLFPHQSDLSWWGLRKGRAGIFAATGLGKTRIFVEIGRLTGQRTLVLSPLGVARQTVAEAAAIGVEAVYARHQADAHPDGLTVTNYDMLRHFDPDAFGCVILDEAAILRDFEGKTRTRLIEMFRDTPYRYAATATPSPNDTAELANYAEFLGIMTRSEMLATWFVHDECFVGSTLVDTPNGTKRIDAIRLGDSVLNAYGCDVVTGTKTRQISRLISVSYGEKQVLCSPNHPWFTRRGWVAAGDLKKGDDLVTRTTAMRMVWEGIHSENTPEQRAERAFLRSILLGEMANEPTGAQGERAYPRDSTEALTRDDGVLRRQNTGERGAQAASDAVKALVAAGGRTEDQRHYEGEGSPSQPTTAVNVPCPRRERQGPDGTTVTAFQLTGRRLGDGSNDLLGTTRRGVSQLLSRRPAASTDSIGRGDRRSFSQDSEGNGARPQEGCVSGFIRVGRVAVYEPGSPEFNRESGGRDTVALYDLAVKHHPSFSIHGALVHNSGWRLKGHARQPFYRWLASWAMSLKRPSDLGHPDDGYLLPELQIRSVIVPTDYVPEGQLFATTLKGITDRAQVRKSTVADRVQAALRLVEAEPDEPWIIWCGLNAEQDAVAAALGDRCVSVYGSLDADEKEARIGQFVSGERNILVTKVAIAGQGLNLQRCARMAFVGLSDSFADYHQAIRRCWRFGQTRPVHAYVVLTDLEEAIYANVLRKEREFEAMTDELVRHVTDFQQAELGQREHRDQIVHGQAIRLPHWLGAAS